MIGSSRPTWSVPCPMPSTAFGVAFKIPIRGICRYRHLCRRVERMPKPTLFITTPVCSCRCSATKLNIYVPLLYSKVYRDYFKSTIPERRFWKTVSFVSTFSIYQPLRRWAPQIPSDLTIVVHTTRSIKPMGCMHRSGNRTGCCMRTVFTWMRWQSTGCVVLGDYEAVMPDTWNRVRYLLSLPAQFTACLGVFENGGCRNLAGILGVARTRNSGIGLSASTRVMFSR